MQQVLLNSLIPILSSPCSPIQRKMAKKGKGYAGTVEARADATSGIRQLCSMATDPNETHNLIDKHPEIVQDFAALAARIVRRGRSTPGAEQPFIAASWRQIDGMPGESGKGETRNE